MGGESSRSRGPRIVCFRGRVLCRIRPDSTHRLLNRAPCHPLTRPDARLLQPEFPSDHDLVLRVLAGELECFRQLVERHQPSVRRLLLGLLQGDRDEAEDLTQEALVRGFQHLGSLERPGRFAPWLLRIARSAALDRLRRRRVERRALDGKAEHLRREQLREVAGAAEELDLAVLPPLEHRALELRYHQGLSYREISGVLELSFHQVDHLIRQARRRLKASLESERFRDGSL